MSQSPSASGAQPMPKTFVRAFDGELLAARRRGMGWTQRELAFAAHTSLATLQKWEGGWSRPDPKAAGRVAAALGCSVRELVGLRDGEIVPGDLRAWAGHSITTAAAELGTTRARLAAIEDGYRRPTGTELTAIAALDQTDPAEVERAWHRARRQLHERLGTSDDEDR